MKGTEPSAGNGAANRNTHRLASQSSTLMGKTHANQEVTLKSPYNYKSSLAKDAGDGRAWSQGRPLWRCDAWAEIVLIFSKALLLFPSISELGSDSLEEGPEDQVRPRKHLPAWPEAELSGREIM